MAETIAIASAVVGAVSSISGGMAANKQAKYNATIARQQAQADADKFARESRFRQGRARANIAGAGIELEGSPLDILESNALYQEVDRQSILQGGEAKARAMTYEGKAAQTAGFIGAGTSLLSGAGKAYSSYQSSKLPWQAKGNVNPAGGYY